jgi:hypothetical protein
VHFFKWIVSPSVHKYRTYIVQPLSLFYSKTNPFLSKPFLHPSFDPQTNIPSGGSSQEPMGAMAPPRFRFSINTILGIMFQVFCKCRSGKWLCFEVLNWNKRSFVRLTLSTFYSFYLLFLHIFFVFIDKKNLLPGLEPLPFKW